MVNPIQDSYETGEEAELTAGRVTNQTGNYIEKITGSVQFYDNITQYITARGDESGLTLVEEAELKEWNEPPNVGSLLPVLEEYHWIFLKDSTDYDVVLLAQYVAKSLHDRLSNFNQEHPPNIFFWKKSSDAIDLFQAIRKQEETSIFILPKLAPRDIQTENTNKALFSKSTQHYYIVVSTYEQEEWRLKLPPQLWMKPRVETIYTADVLRDIFFKRLAETNSDIAKLLRDWTMPNDEDKIAVPRLRDWFRDNAKILRSPLGIDQFLASGVAKPELAREKGWQEYVQDLEKQMRENAKHTTQKAFITDFRSLNQSQQMLVLCATLLDGLLDDQYFVLLETLADRDWGRRNEQIYAVDYHDLRELGKYLSYNGEIRHRIPQTARPIDGVRCKLLEQIWNQNRRQVIALIRTLVDIANGQSPRTTIGLIGDDEKRAYFNAALTGFLGDLSLNHFDDVEAELLQFAIAEDSIWRTSLAQGLASWHLSGKADDLAHRLRKWWDDGSRRVQGTPLVKSVLWQNAKDSGEYEANVARLRMTAIETVGSVLRLQTTTENAESPLFDLLTDFSKDFARLYSTSRTSNIIDSFFRDLFPPLIYRHFDAMRPHIERLAKEKALTESMSFSLAVAHQFAPGEVLKMLKGWSDTYQKQPASNPEKTGTREIMLMLIADTYGYLEEVQNG